MRAANDACSERSHRQFVLVAPTEADFRLDEAAVPANDNGFVNNPAQLCIDFGAAVIYTSTRRR